MSKLRIEINRNIWYKRYILKSRCVEEESVVNPQYYVSGVLVSITLNSLHAERVGEIPRRTNSFDVNAKLESKKRKRSGYLS